MVCACTIKSVSTVVAVAAADGATDAVDGAAAFKLAFRAEVYGAAAVAVKTVANKCKRVGFVFIVLL